MAFRDEKSNKESFVSFGFMIDMFFMIDFYLRSTEFCFPANNKYTKHAMIVDLISSLSVLDMLSYKLTISRYFRLLCLLRILRIPYFFNELCHHLSLRDIRISLGANLLCKLGFFYAIANHWCACIWFIIHRYLERNHESTWATSDCPFGGDVGGDGCLAKWDETLGEHNVCNLDSMRDCYIRALHFAITSLSTVGYGESIYYVKFFLSERSHLS